MAEQGNYHNRDGEEHEEEEELDEFVSHHGFGTLSTGSLQLTRPTRSPTELRRTRCSLLSM